MTFNDYYFILGINETATLEEIVSAYRKQAKMWHPDINNDENAHETMQLINEAYLILSDKEARVRYDTEYSSYKTFVHEQEDFKQGSPKEHNKTFTSSDEILNKWIENARRQAKEMVNLMIDELKGAAEESGKSIISYFIYFAPFIIGYLLIRACSIL